MPVLAPYGFSAAQSRRSVNEYYIPASDTNAYAVGDVVRTNGNVFVGRLPDSRVSTGMLHAVKAASGQAVRGVVVGMVTGPTDTGIQSVPATKQRAYTLLVNDNPQTVWDIQADNAAPLSVMSGMYANYTVSAPTGSVSATRVSASSIGTTVRDLVIVEVLDNSGANSTLRVKFVQHELEAAGASPAISAALQAIVAGAGTFEVYAQPDATGTWANRPNGLVITIPTWASFLTISLGASGGSGGSGRRGASLSARSGGAGGQAGTAVRFRIPLRDSAGALLAATGTLTCAASPAGGAAQTVNDTDGNAGAVSTASSFVYNGVTYSANGGGSAAQGGGTTGVSPGSIPTSMFVTSAPTSTSVSAAVSTSFPNGITGPGSPGGSISTADAILTTAGSQLSQAGGATLTATVASTDGSGYQRGDIMAGVGGAGGASNSAANAGNGGNGIYGSGGGGGGASLNGFNSGAGGRGGAGWAILQWGL